MGLEAFLTQVQYGLRGVGYQEEAGRGLVDTLIRGLSGEDDRYQEFKRTGIVQLGPGCRICSAQALKDDSAFLLVHCLAGETDCRGRRLLHSNCRMPPSDHGGLSTAIAHFTNQPFNIRPQTTSDWG